MAAGSPATPGTPHRPPTRPSARGLTMPRTPNRSDDLAPGSERARKSRGTDQISTGKAGEVVVPDPDPNWHASARMLWDSALDSGVSEFYTSTDYATLHITCTGMDHWLSQGSRKSPE